MSHVRLYIFRGAGLSQLRNVANSVGKLNTTTKKKNKAFTEIKHLLSQKAKNPVESQLHIWCERGQKRPASKDVKIHPSGHTKIAPMNV